MSKGVKLTKEFLTMSVSTYQALFIPWVQLAAVFTLTMVPIYLMLWSPSSNLKSWVIPFILILCHLAARLILWVDKVNRTKSERITPSKRFTIRGPDGQVSINQQEIHAAIIRMAELEDYFERNQL